MVYSRNKSQHQKKVTPKVFTQLKLTPKNDLFKSGLKRNEVKKIDSNEGVDSIILYPEKEVTSNKFDYEKS